MIYEDIVKRFPYGKRSGMKYQCKCPNHDDKKASLSITGVDGRTLVYCHAGCETSDVLSAVGLSIEDLYEENKKSSYKSQNSPFTQQSIREYLLNLNLKDGKKVIDVYNYTDESGKNLYYKFKTFPKGYRFVRLIDGNLIWEMCEGIYYETYDGSNQYSLNKKNTKAIKVKETEMVLYNWPEIKKAKAKGKPIFIVEGEKDVETMKKIGLTAVSSPTGGGKGRKKWTDEYSQQLKGCDIIIFPDNDEAGLQHAETIKKSVLKYCHKVRQYVISDKDKGDVSDWYEALSEDDKLKIKKIILDKVNALKPVVPWWYTLTTKSKTVNKEKIVIGYDTKLIKVNLAEHLLSQINFKVIGEVATSKPIIYVYYNGVYEVRSDLSAEIAPYLPVNYISTYLLKEIESLMFRIKRVNIEFSSVFDGEDYIINFKNGLYDINENRLLKHTPEYKTTIQIQSNYNPDAENNGYWDRYIADLSEGKEENKKILQEMAGLIISNIPGYRVKQFLGLWGPGNTGKGKFWDVFHKIIGESAVGVISLEELSESGGRFSSIALFGKTFVYDGEISKQGIKDPTKIKKITGGDNLKGERKGKDVFNFKFRGVYAIACNNLPILFEEFAEYMYDRIQILPCNNVIPKEKQDKFLVENIVENDSEYIVVWALEGLKRFINNNYEFSYCEAVERTRKYYKTMCDTVYAFIEECYEITGKIKSDRVPLTELRSNYINYCEAEGINNKVENKKEFIKRCENIPGLKFGKVSVDCIKGLRQKKASNYDANS